MLKREKQAKQRARERERRKIIGDS